MCQTLGYCTVGYYCKRGKGNLDSQNQEPFCWLLPSNGGRGQQKRRNGATEYDFWWLGGPGVQDRGVEGRIMAEQQFCLRWNNFQSNIVTSFENLLDKEQFVDVTLTAEGKSLKAHKVLLSACSPYFTELFRDLPQHQHPVIVLRDTGFLELKSLLSFIYHGEVNVSQDRLGLLLKTAESLRIKGLAQDKRTKDFEQLSTVTTSPSKEGEENFDHLERERRTLSPNNTVMDFGLSMCNASLPPTNPLVPSEPPSHKPPILHPSPPAKKRKTPHSPHTGTRVPGPSMQGHTPPGHTPPGHVTPGHTPPGQTPPGHTPPNYTPTSSGGGPPSVGSSIREMSVNSSHAQLTPPRQMPPLQHTTPPSSSSSSLPSSEEDNKVVNLVIGDNGTLSRPQSPTLRIVPKLEVGDDDVINLTQAAIMLRERDLGGGDSDQEMEEREPPLLHHDEDSRDNNSESNSISQDMIPLPHLPVQAYVPYHGASPLDTYPGPSGVITPSPASSWRSSTHPESPQDGKGGHPVFNELFGGEGVGCGGKKAVPTPCPVCAKVLSNAYNMRVHLETHQDISYKCLICGIITRTRDTMRKHLSNVHKLRNIELKNSFKKITGKSSSGSTTSNSLSSTVTPLTPTKGSKGRASKITSMGTANWTPHKTELKWAVPTPKEELSKRVAPATKEEIKWTPPALKEETKWTPPALKEETKWTPPDLKDETKWTPTTTSQSCDAINYSKGSLASIVNKLSQKQ